MNAIEESHYFFRLGSAQPAEVASAAGLMKIEHIGPGLLVVFGENIVLPVAIDTADFNGGMDAASVRFGGLRVTIAACDFGERHGMDFVGNPIRMAGGAGETHLPVNGGRVLLLIHIKRAPGAVGKIFRAVAEKTIFLGRLASRDSAHKEYDYPQES